MNPLLFGLTKLHILSLGGKFVRTQSLVTTAGEEQEVVVFSGAKPLYTGQCTPYKTVVIHEEALNNKELLDYVLIHEIAHTKQWWSILIYPLCVLPIIGLIVLTGAIISLILWAVSMNLGYFVQFAIGILISVIFITIPCLFSWIMEALAEFQVIKTLGLKQYEDIAKLSGKRKLGIGQKVIIRATHPPKHLVIKAWSLLHKS